MTDTTSVPAATTISMNSSWQVFFAITALVFSASMITYLVVYGNATNSLHQSALSWSYLTGLGVLGAIGFGQIADMLPFFAKKP